MPIDSTHAEYKSRVKQWLKCRDAADGQEAIKARGPEYLPMLDSHKRANGGSDAYAAYKGRALWFGATGRTIQNLTGAIMRTEPVIEVPSQMEEALEDVTSKGQAAVQFVQSVAEELLKVGRFGLLVDRPQGETQPPYLALYPAESITNWLLGPEGPLAVVLKEVVQTPTDPSDPYETEAVTQYRELVLMEGVYHQRIWKEKVGGISTAGATGKTWFIESDTTPLLRGAPMDFIPWVFISADGDAVSCSKPPLLDLVEVNISHYTLDADYRHGLHFTALPTPVITGYTSSDGEICIGSETAIVVSSPDAKAYMLEFSGQGLGAIEKALEERKQSMAALGAQMIMAPKKAAEAADTVRITKSGEVSLLESLVSRIEEGLENALAFWARWEKLPDTGIEVKLSRNFIDAHLTAQEITALVAAWQQGAFPHSVLTLNLQKGGVIPADADLEDLQKEIEEEANTPAFNTPPVTPPAGGAPAAGGKGTGNGASIGQDEGGD